MYLVKNYLKIIVFASIQFAIRYPFRKKMQIKRHRKVDILTPTSLLSSTVLIMKAKAYTMNKLMAIAL